MKNIEHFQMKSCLRCTMVNASCWLLSHAGIGRWALKARGQQCRHFISSSIWWHSLTFIMAATMNERTQWARVI